MSFHSDSTNFGYLIPPPSAFSHLILIPIVHVRLQAPTYPRMVSTRIERATRDLHFAPSLPPHPDPLEWVAYGSLSKRLLVGSAESLSPDIPAALETALRFAQHLILHPSGLAHAATFIACTTMPDALVEKAIRRVLATRQWTIALDSEIKAGNAMHFGPSKMYTGPLLEELHLWYGLEVSRRP